jgi:hypothetical protein
MTDAYAPAITVPTVAAYACFGFFKFTKPDGSIVYGPSEYVEVTSLA